MDRNNRLYGVVKAFSELELAPDTIDNHTMGYIFEELIRKFSENAEAGDHYTGRDIIKLMVDILLAEDADDIFDDYKVITILDQASGTGGMLSTAWNHIRRLNPTAQIQLFGQEVNPESYAICLAEMMIKGQDADNIRYQDTMKADCFPGKKMRYVLENPPFGTPWGGKDAPEGSEDAVRAEHEFGERGRWGAGLPSTSDMQLLFVQSAIDKLDEAHGRAAIIENGSPLFSGGVSSGESQVRRWLLEKDYLEAIIALPTDLFYNTGIATYIWVLSKNKREERKGKVQLIDATGISHKLRKALGNKRNELTPEDRAEITRLYADFAEGENCKIFPATEFMYREYTVMQPFQRSYAINAERLENLRSSNALNGLYDPVKVAEIQAKDDTTITEDRRITKFLENEGTYTAILKVLKNAQSEHLWMSEATFLPHLKTLLADVTDDKKLIEKVAHGLSQIDKNAEIKRDRKGEIVYDKETKDIERVPYNEDINTYMAREVLPHVPDAKAFFEENLTAKKPVIKTGAEIPFTRYFYTYTQPTPSEELASRFIELETSVQQRLASLFGGDRA
ncbi:HsdM family class I SAM-dependent methyltransferase [Rothia sp. P7181]|uniref:HsdM family class I SAM-dependent methyltransferase n=1 Tax=Rothia sp. P7181 TaxID=3402663 RepID=UPI003AD8385C